MDLMVGHEKSGCAFSHLDRSELDDLLDEILGDQLFFNNLPSQYKGDGQGNPENTRDSAALQRGNIKAVSYTHQRSSTPSQQDNSQSTAVSWESRGVSHSNGITTAPCVATKQNEIDIGIAFDFQEINDHGCSRERHAPETESTCGQESRVVVSTRNRTPSLPLSNAGFEGRRRLQSVPSSDYNSHAYESQDPFADSDRFVHSLRSEEPITWLDQQKLKLRTRQEGKRWMSQSAQQKQLMAELKTAQTMCALKRARQSLNEISPEQHADYISNHFEQNQPPVNHGPGCQERYESLMNDGLGKRDSSQFQRLSVSDENKVEGENRELCRSEKNYYVSGIERPPFTTHQTRYVFSVCSPHVTGVNHGNLSPTMHLLQIANAKPTPPTPQRGESSREAMRHSMMHNLEMEQWEQESHTSLSSRSDATELSSLPKKKKVPTATLR